MATVPVAPAEPALPGDRDIDLRYYAGLVFRHRAFLGACALVGLLLGLVVALVQTPEYRASVLPPEVTARVSVEQASTLGWDRYVGLKGRSIGMRTFGASAPLKALQKKFGFLPESVVAAVKEQLTFSGPLA